METHQGLRVFEQISVSEDAKYLMQSALLGDSSRKIDSTDTTSRDKKIRFPVVSSFLPVVKWQGV